MPKPESSSMGAIERPFINAMGASRKRLRPKHTAAVSISL
ncbi:hypothetical protein EVA_09845 [gut metagenome]|uniref:Uncharacterized protein n=1 Tax=gut metagenome TaxID=749906 RepID=J9GJ82_9ZZZZ